jgi:branched-subunit amino acid aminotransferase/4-amino-4-deoxychorismate lyase
MTETDYVAYHDGEFVPGSELAVPVDDTGFQWGHNVYDLLVTANHEPYQLTEHVERTFRSCRAAKMPIEQSREELADIVEEVVDRNVPDLHADGEFMVWISVSGGWNVYAGEPEPPRVIVRVTELPFARWADDFLEGRHFVTSSYRQLSNESISPLIKHRSRMHFVLADVEAKQADPAADPLLLDQEGNVAETTIGNVFVVTDGVVRTPPPTNALPGVTRDTTIDIAEEEGIPLEVEELQLYDVQTADEVFWTNTSHVVAPITQVDGEPVGDGRPGPVTEQLLSAHSDRMGFDVVERYLRHLPESERPDELRLGGDTGVA